MFDWPAQSQTSPMATSLILIVLVAAMTSEWFVPWPGVSRNNFQRPFLSAFVAAVAPQLAVTVTRSLTLAHPQMAFLVCCCRTR